LTVGGIVATGVVGLFPNLLPSRLDPQFSLTIYNSSSSPYTLKIMTGVALVFVPIVIAYQLWSYMVFSRPIDPAAAASGDEMY
jgi:cytochrome d ubiquinol oxidase subunit II